MDGIVGPLITLLAVILAALVARNATRYAANLQAAQRAHDAQLDHLDEVGSAVLEALTAVQSYVLTTHEWKDEQKARVVFEVRLGKLLKTKTPALIALSRADFLAGGLIWDVLRVQCERALRRLKDVVDGPWEVADLVWDTAVSENPNIFTVATEAIYEQRRSLLADYPVRIEGESLTDRLKSRLKMAWVPSRD